MSTPGPRFAKSRLVLTLAVGLLGCSGAYAASFGHARMSSPQGAPLVIQIPVKDLSATDAQTLSAQAAAAGDWAQAGLTPPVALDRLRVSVEPGMRPQERMLRISSVDSFSGPLADLLLDVHTASGVQRYQVSLVTSARTPAATPAAAAGGSSGGSAVGAAPAGGSTASADLIRVRRGDTLLAIARRHAVPGVTVYQMMIALQRANPQAFIHQNINLVKAGAQLTMPGMDELLAITDREARRQFQTQTAAYAALRGRLADGAGAVSGSTRQGRVSEAPASADAAPAVGRGDHLQLGDAQHARPDSSADSRTAQRLARADAQGRIGQLEDNVQNLNEALKMQGDAARDAVIGGAKQIGDSISGVAQTIAEAGKTDAANAAMRQAGGASPTAAAGAANGNAAGAPDAPIAGQAGADSLDPAVVPPEAAARAAQAEVEAARRSQGVVNWLQEHLLIAMTGLLALIVFIIAWLLRRAGSTRDETYGAAQATEAKVRETLKDIDLELKPRQDEPVTKD